MGDTVNIKQGNSVATIHLFGATLTSWIVDNEDILFLSKKSVFDNKKAIRGGVPVVFPQFGPWLIGPQHGFARIQKWKLKGSHYNSSNSVTLILEETEQTLSIWNYNFRIEYTLTLVDEKKLKMDVSITNTSTVAFQFTFLLHTYFSVPDISACEIKGLSGCSYYDKVNDKDDVDDKEVVTISEHTDRVYKNTSIMHTITNVSGNRTVRIEKFNLPDTVVWNPWIEDSKAMSDFGDDEWKNMVCVEAGYVAKPAVLDQKETFVASQILSVL